MREQLDFIRRGGVTRRYHTWSVLHQQSVAEHSFHVAMLCLYLTSGEYPGTSMNLILAALVHDLSEHVMGDVPSTAKLTLPHFLQANGSTRSFREVWSEAEEGLLNTVELDVAHLLPDAEKAILKFADNAEGALYCIEERRLGNAGIVRCYRTFRSYIAMSQLDIAVYAAGRAKELVNYIDEEWEKANGSQR